MDLRFTAGGLEFRTPDEALSVARICEKKSRTSVPTCRAAWVRVDLSTPHVRPSIRQARHPCPVPGGLKDSAGRLVVAQ